MRPIVFIILTSFFNDFKCSTDKIENEDMETIVNGENYRRFEMIISNLMLGEGFKDTYCEGNLSGCNLTTKVEFNGITESRNISLEEEYDATDGIFLLNFVHIERGNGSRPFFNASNTLSITIKCQNITQIKDVFNAEFVDFIHVIPNTERKMVIDLETKAYKPITTKLLENSTGIFISYRCKGYTGLNCQFECDNTSHQIECDFETGTKFCKNGNNNPPTCDTNSTNCTEKDVCKNGGTCVKIIDSRYFCECLPGYIGKNCEHFECEVPCDPNYGICTGANTCNCSVSYKSGNFCNETVCESNHSPCKNNAECSIYENEIFCRCNPHTHAGKFCEEECVNKCAYGICTRMENITFCSCIEGFEGENCNLTMLELDPIFESGYVSAKNQKITYASLFFTMIIATVVAIGMGSYFRKSIKMQVEIINRSHATVQGISNQNQLALQNNSYFQSNMNPENQL